MFVTAISATTLSNVTIAGPTPATKAALIANGIVAMDVCAIWISLAATFA
jgi:hypothetical protein